MLKYIIYFFGLELEEGSSPIVEYGFNVALVCLVIFICFINVFGYLIALYFLQNKDIENKYPKLKVFFNYFKKSTFYYIVFDGILGLLFLIMLIVLGFYPLFK